MILKAFSSRHYTPIFDVNEPFVSEIDEQDEYMFSGGFDLYKENEDIENYDDAERIIATVRGIFFDEDKILDDDQDIVDLADMLDGDVYTAMYALSKSKLYNQDPNEDKIFLPLFSCYVQRVYVYPEFRQSGIAQYIFTNMEQIFLHCFNTNIHSFVIYPKPQQPDPQGNWINSSDDKGVMLNCMVKVIKSFGFSPLGSSGYFAKNCAVY